MNLTDKELEELKVILIQKDWIVYAYLDNKEVYVSTEYGLGMYIAFCHWTEYGHKLEFTDMERPIFKKEEHFAQRSIFHASHGILPAFAGFQAFLPFL